MTFKSASQSRATQRQAKRASDEGTKPAPWAVVAFRPGRTNRGKPCVYRRVWPFRDGSRAKFADEYEASRVPEQWTYVALVTVCGAHPLASTLPPLPPDCRCDGIGYSIEARGDGRIVAEWKRQRKGVNRDAHPFLSGTYMHRELRGDRSFSEEGRK